MLYIVTSFHRLALSLIKMKTEMYMVGYNYQVMSCLQLGPGLHLNKPKMMFEMHMNSNVNVAG